MFGSGSSPRMACPIGLMRSAGITLPGKQPAPPVLTLHGRFDAGSLMNCNCPWLFRVSEKSPARSLSVGMVSWRSVPGSVRGSRSCEKKKNSLSRFRLKVVPGSTTGPPRVQAVLLKR